MQRGVVGGVAHPRGGQFGQDGVESGARFGGQIAADRAHPVEALCADGDAAPAGPVLVGEVAVGVEASVSLSASLANSSGRCSPPRRASCASALWRVVDVDEVGQPVPEAADHRAHGRCRWCRRAAPRRWRAARGGNGSPVSAARGPQIRGLVDAPRRFGAGDPQPVGQRRAQCAAQLRRVGLAPSWLIKGCSMAGSRRRIVSQRCSNTNRSGVVSASNDRSRARLMSASSASNTSTTSSRQLERMFEL